MFQRGKAYRFVIWTAENVHLKVADLEERIADEHEILQPKRETEYLKQIFVATFNRYFTVTLNRYLQLP